MAAEREKGRERKRELSQVEAHFRLNHVSELKLKSNVFSETKPYFSYGIFCSVLEKDIYIYLFLLFNIYKIYIHIIIINFIYIYYK